MSFTNLYYKRTAGTPKACFVCYRPTPIVLATAQTVDFLYACESHLKDPGFASRIADDPKPALSAEEIAQVKTDWEERQKRKAEKAKEKEKDGENGNGDDKDGGKSKDDSSKDKTPPKAISPAPSTTPQQPTHEKYTLHRDIFALRTAEHRKRRQTSQAKQLAPRLPVTPRGAVN